MRKKGRQKRVLSRWATSSALLLKKCPFVATWTMGCRADKGRGRKTRLEDFAEVQVRDDGSLDYHTKQSWWTGNL